VVSLFLTLLWAIFYRSLKVDVSSILFLKEAKLSIFSLKRANLVLVRGGDNLSDAYGLKPLLANLFNISVAIILKKRIVLMGHTIGPFNRIISICLVKHILRIVDYIVVRDSYSETLAINQMGIDESKVQFLLDVAFLLEYSSNVNPEMSENMLVGVVPSDLAYKYRLKEPSKDSRYLAYVKILTETIDYLTGECKANVLLIPHTFYPGNDDMKVAFDIYRTAIDKKKVRILKENDPRKVKQVISHLDLLISPRMHPIIHALSSGTPVIGIDYNLKIKELMEFFGLGDFVIDIAELEYSNVKRKLIRLNRNCKNIREMINAKSSKCTQEHKETYVRILRDFAEKDEHPCQS
jgi:colanic acid/amylovoran biosynthesis protein